MKKIAVSLLMAWAIMGCKTVNTTSDAPQKMEVSINLVDVKNDQVEVNIKTPTIKQDEIVFYVPKIIPGTYAIDNYGKYIENFNAYDQSGKKLKTAKFDDNSWTIFNAKQLSKVSYKVNDTYDIESEHEVFSPSGTNIIENKQFMLNLHGFVGYFKELKEIPYEINIAKPAALYGATALTDLDKSNTADQFVMDRYAEVVDHPIMYNVPDTASFKVKGMDILISVYSPSKKHTAASIKPAMEKMITAQKNFLGDFNSTKKYAILLYLSSLENDAQGFGALEHPTSTTVVMPEMMEKDALEEQLKDVVSHEFFHIVTPLSIHSKEIQYFDYNEPKMSEHLWMYEGVTEYFANLFQVNQGLIEEGDFFDRMQEKIQTSTQYDDNMPFTKMSKNVLSAEIKDQYVNVYQKGALIAMCLDIQLRESSNGKMGILDLMKKLSKDYGNNKPFDDSELFQKITDLTYPEIGAFLKKYVSGDQSIPYITYFEKMGLGLGEKTVDGNPFLSKEMVPYINMDPESGIIFIPEGETNAFFKNLGMAAGDIIKEVNGVAYNKDSIYDLLVLSESMKNNDPIKITYTRNGKEKTVNKKIVLPKETISTFIVKDQSKNALKNAWLKN